MITCNCPPPASLPDLECVRCSERFGQIQKVAFQRIMNDDGTKNKFSAVSGFSEINSLANWQVRMTAADSTKIVISPYIYSPSQENGAARTFGGGKAPDGLCGALYAAKMMQPDHAESIEDVFKRGAQGCTKCKEIRPNKIIPCNRCVELAGEALDFLEK